MCGIAGIVFKEEHSVSYLQKASELLKHRGPDDEGFLLLKNESFSHLSGPDSQIELPKIEGDFTIGLVHRRLSILDLSPSGHQPMESGDLAITYNGEIYNYLEIREELETKGHAFSSNSDTEVILKAYQEWGSDCQSRFIGMWAFAILDKHKNNIFLSRDRYGIKPLYFSLNNKVFAFASEMKPLLDNDLASRNVSRKKLAEYLSFGTLSKPYDNLFDDITDFPPGSYGYFDIRTHELAIEQYYHGSDAEEDRSFSDLFENSIDLHLRSDVEVGACLSGGLDSTAIVTALTNKNQQVKTFTASFPGSKVDEKSYVDMVKGEIEKKFCYPKSSELLEEIDKLILHQELPIGSSSIFAQWSVMKLAAENKIKVILDGQGADEILGGYYNFAGIHVIELAKKGQFGGSIKAYSALKDNFTPNMKNATARAGYYFFPKGIQRGLRKQTRLGMKFINPKFEEFLKNITVPPRGGKSFKKHSELSLKFGLYDLLRYEDRNSMAFSIESRVPFLDHRIVEHSLNLPGKEKVVDGWTKYPVRSFLKGKQPEELVFRKDKIGFATPQSEWKNELSKEMKAYFSSADIPDFFDKTFILSLVEKDLSNSELSEFFRLYSILKWIQIFKVKIV